MFSPINVQTSYSGSYVWSPLVWSRWSWRLGHFPTRSWLHFWPGYIWDIQPLKWSYVGVTSPSVGYGGLQLVPWSQCCNNLFCAELLLSVWQPSSHYGAWWLTQVFIVSKNHHEMLNALLMFYQKDFQIHIVRIFNVYICRYEFNSKFFSFTASSSTLHQGEESHMLHDAHQTISCRNACYHLYYYQEHSYCCHTLLSLCWYY